MPAKQVIIGEEARHAMARGAVVLAQAVQATLGPRGRNVLLQRSFGAPTVTKDGVSVAKEIELEDPLENMGAQMVREVAAHTADIAGDGTTTATVLAKCLFEEGIKAVTSGLNPMDLKRGIDRAVEAAVEELEKLSDPCENDTAIAQVATISANGDEAIGEIIADAISRVGREGVTTIEESSGLANELDVVEGMQFDRGYLSAYFVTDRQHMVAEFENCLVLLCDRKISAIHDILPLLESVTKSGQPLLLIAEDVEGEALATLVVNALRGSLNAVAVKAPGFGERRKAILQDVAILTGASIVSDETGLALDKVGVTELGHAKKVRISKDDTTIVEGGGNKEDIDARAAEIRREIDRTTSDYDREKLQERLAKLAGGVAVIKVGAATEIEMKEKKDRVDDALSATRAAIAEGIVPGGGVALVRAMQALKRGNVEGANPDQNVGINIAIRALEQPLREIAYNAGVEPAMVIYQISQQSGSYGFNAQTEEYGDLKEMGIVDPTKVVRVALQNAASVAGLMITTEALVADLPKQTNEGPHPGEMMPTM